MQAKTKTKRGEAKKPKNEIVSEMTFYFLFFFEQL